MSDATDWQEYAADIVSGDQERIRKHLPQWMDPARRTQPRETEQYCAGCGFAVYPESSVVHQGGTGFVLHPNCEAPPVKPVPKCVWCGGVPVGLFDSKVEPSGPVNLCKLCADLDDAHEDATLYDRFVRSRCEVEALAEALRLILASEISCEDDCVRDFAGSGAVEHDPLCATAIARKALGL